MPCIPIRDGQKLHLMTHFYKKSGGSAPFDITIVWVRPDKYNPQGLGLCLNSIAAE
jgi:hypothetical protein